MKIQGIDIDIDELLDATINLDHEIGKRIMRGVQRELVPEIAKEVAKAIMARNDINRYKETNVQIPNEPNVVALITEIVDRAVKLIPSLNPILTRMHIGAVHANGCPLRLEELAKADDYDLIREVAGICRYVDVQTGKLKNGFRPQYAAAIS